MCLCSERSIIFSLDLLRCSHPQTEKLQNEQLKLCSFLDTVRKIHQKALSGSAQVPLLEFQWLNGHPQIKTGILNRNSLWICPTSRRAGGLNASGDSSFQTILPFLLVIKLQRNLLSVNSQNIHRVLGP